MEKMLMVSQVIISVLLALIILVQGKDEGFAAGGGGGTGFQVTRRGAEKIIFRITVILAVLFLVNAFLFIFV